MPEARVAIPVRWLVVLAGISVAAVGLGLVDRWAGGQASSWQVLDDRLDDIEQRLVSARYLTPGLLRLAEELAIRRDLAGLEAEFAIRVPRSAPPQSVVETDQIATRVQAFAAMMRVEVLRTRSRAHALHAGLLTVTGISAVLLLGAWFASQRLRPAGAAPVPEPLPPTRVDVAPGVGPVAIPAASPRPTRAYSSASGMIPAIGRLQGRVLLVEDNPINQRVTVRQLGELGLDVELAATAEAGIEQLRRSRFAAVLMDLQLPGMDGLTATRAWRSEEDARGLGRVPVIALTANALGMDRDACHASGMDGYLAKPARLQDLHRVLSKAFADGIASPVHPPLPPDASAVSGPSNADDVPLHDSGMWHKLRSETGASDPRMLEELLAELRRQAPDQLAAIEAAAVAGDGERIRAVAHRLKGSAGMLGLPRLAAAAKAVELPAKNGDLAGSVAHIPALRRAVVDTFHDPAVTALG